MENPEEEIRGVVLQLTSASSPDLQRRTVERYMTPDVAFRHPICAVESGSNSRKTVLGIYQWYRVLSPRTEAQVNSVVWDKEHGYMFLDVQQWFRLFWSPARSAPARLCTRLTLRREEDGLYYIAMQEDFYHPDDFITLLLPPLVPFIRMVLLIAGLLSSLNASFAQFFGLWRPIEANGDSSHLDGPGEEDLYNDVDKHN
ncbi:hypothetical protein D9756_010303 [Leucocoprinus leucothites]|uniref:SigF-like NTF2-like domain-containing protein n=1 Tax=Leucocoprinus leucothites TaxID=201217 RepID=A0A8H5CTN4_9AGAR|nr:hypothetical protein D9756_010303 [Leucoagaricus leucothites]